jgi:hypothetical protein
MSDKEKSEWLKEIAQGAGPDEVSEAFNRIMHTTAPVKELSGTIAQFYICRDNEIDAATCRDSMKNKFKISITGSTIDRQHTTWFEGIVQSVDENARRGAGKHHKVTIRA